MRPLLAFVFVFPRCQSDDVDDVSLDVWLSPADLSVKLNAAASSSDGAALTSLDAWVNPGAGQVPLLFTGAETGLATATLTDDLLRSLGDGPHTIRVTAVSVGGGSATSTIDLSAAFAPGQPTLLVWDDLRGRALAEGASTIVSAAVWGDLSPAGVRLALGDPSGAALPMTRAASATAYTVSVPWDALLEVSGSGTAANGTVLAEARDGRDVSVAWSARLCPPNSQASCPTPGPTVEILSVDAWTDAGGLPARADVVVSASVDGEGTLMAEATLSGADDDVTLPMTASGSRWTVAVPRAVWVEVAGVAGGIVEVTVQVTADGARPVTDTTTVDICAIDDPRPPCAPPAE